MQQYRSFAEFYPYYLQQHGNHQCRRLHVIGSCAVIVILGYAMLTANAGYLLLTPVAGYGFAWIGHAVFEHNKPATFSYPVYSLIGDWVMFKDIIIGKIPW